MKKIIYILAVVFLSISSVSAQNNYKIVKGFVIDNDGTPIPGAEVSTPGGIESVLTDSDGSFSISVHTLLKKLTASYDGLAPKTLRLKSTPYLVFTLKKEPNHSAFLNAVLGYSHNMNTHYKHTVSFGLMAGMLGKWGFYGKGGYDYNTDGFSITAGMIKSIYYRTIYLYVGAGYGMANRGYNNVGNYYYCNDKRSGIAGDIGFIVKTGTHFNLTLGYNIVYTFPYTGRFDINVGSNYVHGLELGFGYVF